MRLILLFTLLYSLIPTLSLGEEKHTVGTEYTVGKQSCEDFEYAENWYNNYDRNGAYAHIIGKHATGLYGTCLVLKGIATNDDATKRQGLALLDWLTDEHSGMNSVTDMFFLAKYRSSGGRFTKKTEVRNIDMAIRAFIRVLFFIKLDKDYPGGDSESEKLDQMEIVSHAKIPTLYGIKLKYGLKGSHNRYLKQSPSYEGDKAKLKLYLEPNTDPAVMDPAYSDLGVITDSFNQMISSSQACLDLPYKHYHRKDIYNYYQQRCRILNSSGYALLPLEEKRQEALIDKTCSQDVLTCDKYMDVYNEMDNLVKDTIEKLRAVPNPWLQ